MYIVSVGDALGIRNVSARNIDISVWFRNIK